MMIFYIRKTFIIHQHIVVAIDHDINLTSIIMTLTNIKLLFIHLNNVKKSEFLRCTQDVVTITQKLFRFKKYTRKGIFF